jgi:hypothetical protein
VLSTVGLAEVFQFSNTPSGPVTLALFLITLTAHWIFEWLAYAREQEAHGQAIEVAGYTIQMMRPGELAISVLQLSWQVAGLAILLHVGSPRPNGGRRSNGTEN